MPTIVRQIFGHMDFDTLLKCRTISKTIQDFLDNEKQRNIWVSMIDKVRHETVDIFLHDPEGVTFQMSKEAISDDHSKWIVVLDKVKENGTIKDIILICNLMKQTENLAIAFNSFGPLENLCSFYDTGDSKFKFEELVRRDMKLFKTWNRLNLETENSLISTLWDDYLVECVGRSDNSEVVYFFMEKMMVHDHIKLRDDIKNKIWEVSEASDTESDDDDDDDEEEDEDGEIEKYMRENKFLKRENKFLKIVITLLFLFYAYCYFM